MYGPASARFTEEYTEVWLSGGGGKATRGADIIHSKHSSVLRHRLTPGLLLTGCGA